MAALVRRDEGDSNATRGIDLRDGNAISRIDVSEPCAVRPVRKRDDLKDSPPRRSTVGHAQEDAVLTTTGGTGESLGGHERAGLAVTADARVPAELRKPAQD